MRSALSDAVDRLTHAEVVGCQQVVEPQVAEALLSRGILPLERLSNAEHGLPALARLSGAMILPAVAPPSVASIGRIGRAVLRVIAGRPCILISPPGVVGGDGTISGTGGIQRSPSDQDVDAWRGRVHQSPNSFVLRAPDQAQLQELGHEVRAFLRCSSARPPARPCIHPPGCISEHSVKDWGQLWLRNGWDGGRLKRPATC